MARYGLNVRDVQDVIELAIGGHSASTFFEGERRFDITVRYVPEARTDPSAIGSILVTTRDGGRVPLSQLASIEVATGASIIARRENRRQISVRTNIRGRDQGGFVADALQRFARDVTLPQGYTVDWGGQFENLARARKRLALILPVTIGVIFALLFFAFGDTTYAGLVLLNVPFSLVGGILALYFRGHQPERVGGGGLHLAVRRGGDERCPRRVRDQPAASGRRGRTRRRHPGRAGADASGPDDDRGRDARHGAGRPCDRHRVGRAAAAGDRRRRRADLDAGVDAVRATRAYSAGGLPKRKKGRGMIEPVKPLLMFVNETDRWRDAALYHAIVLRLRRLSIAGATAQTGIIGFGHHHVLHHKGLFGISDDRPVTITAVDQESKLLRAVLPELREMVREGLDRAARRRARRRSAVTRAVDSTFSDLNTAQNSPSSQRSRSQREPDSANSAVSPLIVPSISRDPRGLPQLTGAPLTLVDAVVTEDVADDHRQAAEHRERLIAL